MDASNTWDVYGIMNIPELCPCCTVDQLPHREDCTFHQDAPTDASNFDWACRMRSRANLLEHTLRVVRGLATRGVHGNAAANKSCRVIVDIVDQNLNVKGVANSE